MLFFFFLTNWVFIATLYWASTSAPFFLQHLLTSCLCHIVIIVTVFKIIIIIFVILICDQCFFKINLFNWRVFTLQYCGGFLPYIDMNQPRVHMWPPRPEPHSHLPTHPICLGCPGALALSTLLHASNLHWPSVLHMVIYMFQCCSLKSSHT